jgi:hypothetical protein
VSQIKINKIMFKGKIFGIGYPKTGTTSLHFALNSLGYKSLHEPMDFLELVMMKGIYRFPKTSKCGNKNNRGVKWDAITDFGATFYYQLDTEYPDSKFILTTRDTDKWWKSWIGHVIGGQPPNVKGTNDYSHVLSKGNVWLAKQYDMFGGIGFDEETCRHRYELNNCLIKEYFSYKPHDLLVLPLESENKMNLLCGFLDCPAIKRGYPHKNLARRKNNKNTTPKRKRYKRLRNNN